MSVIYANVLLLNNKIINWHTGYNKKNSIHDFRSPTSKINKKDFKVEIKEFVEDEVNTNHEIFTQLSKKFYKQWDIHKDLKGTPPFTKTINNDEKKEDCNCIVRLQERIQTKAIEQKKDWIEIEATFKDTSLAIKGKDAKQMMYTTALVSGKKVTKTGKNKGVTRDKKEEVSIFFKHCPFCGEEIKQL